MLNTPEDRAAMKAEIVAELMAVLPPALLEAVRLRVQVSPQALTGTRIIITLKASDAPGEGPQSAAP